MALFIDCIEKKVKGSCKAGDIKKYGMIKASVEDNQVRC